MFGNLLKKILPKKKEQPQITGRVLYGRNNVGYPTMQVSKEIDDTVQKYYPSIKPLIKFYKDSMFFKALPSLIDNALDDEKLEKLSGRNVQMVNLLLFRDMLRHIAVHITPDNAPENWPDLFAQDVLEQCHMLSDKNDSEITIKQQLFAELPLSNIEDKESLEWVKPIVELIHISEKDLYGCHSSLTTSILKKVSKKKRK